MTDSYSQDMRAGVWNFSLVAKAILTENGTEGHFLDFEAGGE